MGREELVWYLEFGWGRQGGVGRKGISGRVVLDMVLCVSGRVSPLGQGRDPSTIWCVELGQNDPFWW